MTDKIDCKTLSDEELLELIVDDIYEGYIDEIPTEIQELLDRGMSPYQALTQGLMAGMDVVGDDFRDGVLFVLEVLMASRAMKAGMDILRPKLTETGASQIGKVVLGTVKGDIHDIGKNLVGMMLEGAGFEVIDLGVNISVEAYLEAMTTHQPNILGMSALLTTTMPYMGTVIEALKREGLRQQVTVLVGGTALNSGFAAEIGADAYCRDAVVAVETARNAVKQRGAA